MEKGHFSEIFMIWNWMLINSFEFILHESLDQMLLQSQFMDETLFTSSKFSFNW